MGHTQLRRLSIGGTRVTDQGIELLEMALPNCRVLR
jgi:hypothetical protein